VSASDNRALVERYFRAIGGDGDLADVFAPDVQWHLPRTNPMGSPHVGLDAVMAMLTSGVDLYDPTAMQTEVHTMIADDDHVAVRLTFRTRTAAGEPYEGDYQFQFACEDGRITAVWESPDTLYQERMGVFAAYDRA
jgi:ketosteroid isomerase-like protein